MDLHLQPQAGICFVSGTEFQQGDRVISFLVKTPEGEFSRYDCLESVEGQVGPIPGDVLCRWVRRYKPPVVEENPDKALKMSAESLFLSLTVESEGPVTENTALKQFLALMLERKRVLKNRGLKEDGSATLYEHRPTRQIIEVPVGEMDAGFFLGVQDKLGVLLGEPASPKQPSPETRADAGPAETAKTQGQTGDETFPEAESEGDSDEATADGGTEPTAGVG